MQPPNVPHWQQVQTYYIRGKLQCLGHPFILIDRDSRFDCEDAIFNVNESARVAQVTFLKFWKEQIEARIAAAVKKPLPTDVHYAIVLAHIEWDLEELATSAEDGYYRAQISRADNPLSNIDKYFEWTVLETEEDLQNHHKRLERLYELFRSNDINSGFGFSAWGDSTRKITLNRESILRLADFYQAYGKRDLSKIPLYIPPYADVDPNLPDERLEEEKRRLEVVVRKLQDAFLRHSEFLRIRYLPYARENPGMYGLPGYEKAYKRLILKFAVIDKFRDPDKIFEFMTGSITFSHETMEQVIGNINSLKGKKFKEIAIVLRSPENFISDPDAAFAKFKQICANSFDSLKNSSFLCGGFVLGHQMCKIIRLDPRYEDEDMSPAIFFKHTPVSVASSLQGLVVNVKKLMKIPTHLWDAMALHELYPGKYFQHEQVANSNNQFADFMLKFRGTDAWAHWAEMQYFYDKEVPVQNYRKDAKAHFGWLERNLLNEVLAVVDIGLHWKGWTIRQSVNFILENAAFISRKDATEEVLKCCESPGMALGPKLGVMRIMHLRTLLYVRNRGVDDGVLNQAIMETEFMIPESCIKYIKLAEERVKVWEGIMNYTGAQIGSILALDASFIQNALDALIQGSATFDQAFWMNKIRGYIGVEGIYDIPLIIKNFPTYKDWFIDAAFGLESDNGWNGIKLASHLVIHSTGDELVDIVQSKEWYDKLVSLRTSAPGTDNWVLDYDVTSMTEKHDDVLLADRFYDLIAIWIKKQ
ncbi:UNVERIFIED_CONTAM: hypothetical protein HDU68_010278 [Siphonaria sp. JEL0065]|nr:hypothetical protein HDU68_010278 [Siphonaria sp. JEL0065]